MHGVKWSKAKCNRVKLFLNSVFVCDFECRIQNKCFVNTRHLCFVHYFHETEHQNVRWFECMLRLDFDWSNYWVFVFVQVPLVILTRDSKRSTPSRPSVPSKPSKPSQPHNLEQAKQTHKANQFQQANQAIRASRTCLVLEVVRPRKGLRSQNYKCFPRDRKGTWKGAASASAALSNFLSESAEPRK